MEPVLECRGITKTYLDGTRELVVLDGVDLTVPDQTVLAISGPSGVGKSTLLHIMGTLDRPTRGEVLFHGKPLASMGRGAVNRLRNEGIGFVFQFYHLLPEFTALENVMMPALCRGANRKKCHGRSEELLCRVGLQDRMTHKPGMLSGGEQQRVAIARALFNRPAVVLADEPTGNLDRSTADGVFDLMLQLARDQGTAFVMVTHDESLAARCDRVMRLVSGVLA